MKIKIVSGHSEKGGSTIAFINLTNKFNENGYDCTFYGPHQWHLDKCKSDNINNLKFESDDIILIHFLKLPSRPLVKKIIFVCHEKWWWSFKNINKFFDTCVFLHEEHRKFHKEYDGEYVFIPNLKETLHSIEKNELELVAGVIGTIEDRKQTHLSIDMALKDGCEKVLVFGHIGDFNYYDKFVKKFVDNKKVILMGYSSNKQEMYNSVGRVYHYSKGEVASLVKDECHLTNTKFFGNEETENEVSKLTNNQIIEEWKKILK